MIQWLRNQFTPAPPSPPPADLPGALIPGWVIDAFPLLSRMPDLIGLDLRKLTESVFVPMEIEFIHAFDGMEYSGMAIPHERYAIVVNYGNSMIFSHPFWRLDIFALHTNLDYIIQLGDKLIQTYDSLPRNKLNSYDLGRAELYDSALMSWWEGAHFLPREGRHMKCKLWFYSIQQTRAVLLRYEIGGD